MAYPIVVGDVITDLRVGPVLELIERPPTVDFFATNCMGQAALDLNVGDYACPYIIKRAFAIITWLKATVYEAEVGFRQNFALAAPVEEESDAHLAVRERAHQRIPVSSGRWDVFGVVPTSLQRRAS